MSLITPMFEELPTSVQDAASVITFLLPGFLAVSLFEVTNPALARDRLPLQWTMWSLAMSLLIYTAFYGLYSWRDWPTSPLDFKFYVPLLLGSILLGWLSGKTFGSNLIRPIFRKLGLFIRPWVWVEVIAERRWAVVHLTDGTIIYGYPHKYTDDRREGIREIYLVKPHRWDNQTKLFDPVSQADGIMVSSERINYVTFVANMEELKQIPLS